MYQSEHTPLTIVLYSVCLGFLLGIICGVQMSLYVYEQPEYKLKQEMKKQRYELQQLLIRKFKEEKCKKDQSV